MTSVIKELELKSVRRRVLDAARNLLLQRGQARFSMESVGCEAALSRRTVYNQFEDRDALFRAVCTELIAEVETALPRSLAASVPPQAAVEGFVGTCLRAIADEAYRELRAILDSGNSELPSMKALYRDRIEQPLQWAIERYLLTAARQGQITLDEPELEARRLLAMILSSAARPDLPAAFHPEEIATIFLTRLTVRQPPQLIVQAEARLAH